VMEMKQLISSWLKSDFPSRFPTSTGTKSLRTVTLRTTTVTMTTHTFHLRTMSVLLGSGLINKVKGKKMPVVFVLYRMSIDHSLEDLKIETEIDQITDDMKQLMHAAKNDEIIEDSNGV
jgi:hypothetical protein